MILIKKSSNGQYYTVVTAKNGQVLVTGELLKRKSNAKKQIRALQREFTGDNSVMEVVDMTGKEERRVWV